jgi:hypothetical protein
MISCGLALVGARPQLIRRVVRPMRLLVAAGLALAITALACGPARAQSEPQLSLCYDFYATISFRLPRDQITAGLKEEPHE